MRMSVILVLTALMLLLVPAARGSLGIAVEPTALRISLSSSNPQLTVSVFVWNPSDTPDNYTFIVSDSLRNYIQQNCSGNNWCEGKGFYVAANTSRNGQEVLFTFVKNGTQDIMFNGSITARANPILNNSGTVGISPQIAVRVELQQVNDPTTSTTSSTTTTTVTATTVTTDYVASSTTTIVHTPVIATTVRPQTTIPQQISEMLNRSTSTVTTTTVAQPENSLPFWIYGIIALAAIAAGSGGLYLFLKWYF